MSIRTRLLLLAGFVAMSILIITVLFSSALSSLVAIDREKGYLAKLSDAVRGLSIGVNSLDSNQYRNMLVKFHDAVTRANNAFDALSELTILPRANEELASAFEVLGNLRALIADDIMSLDSQYSAFQADLETYFLESNSTSVRKFYTDDRIRARYDLTEVLARLDTMIDLINGLSETLAGVNDTIESQVEIIEEQTGNIRDQTFFITVTVSVLLLAIVVGVSIVLGTSIARRVKDMQRRLVPVSQGDFSEYLPVEGSDEVAGITKTVNQLLDSLNHLLVQVRDQAVSLRSMGENLSSRMQETTVAVEHIQGNLQSSHGELEAQTHAVSASVDSAGALTDITENLSQAFVSQMEILATSSSGIEQIIANIGSVNTNTSRAEDSTRMLVELSKEGQTSMDSVAKSVGQIARSSENLVQVTAIINDIADQTNLLAMNASIEAAHAGTSGRGFGVVAGEIRKLAEQAASQAKEISKDLQIVNENIRAIGSVTHQAVEGFRRIVAQTGLVGSIVQEVQISMDEQNKGGSLILEGIRRLHEINDEVGAGIEKMKQGEGAILEKLLELAQRNALVNQNNEGVRGKTSEITLIVRHTNELAESTRVQIETLESEIQKFRTRSSSQE